MPIKNLKSKSKITNMSAKTLTIDGKPISAREEETILQAAREAGIKIPTLCHLDGVMRRRRLPPVPGGGRPARTSCCPPAPRGCRKAWTCKTRQRAPAKYRTQIVELLFAERNHVCAVCVANGHCELQDAGIAAAWTMSATTTCSRRWSVDLTHEQFGMDHNRCILCTRCVRVCDEIEGAHTWDVLGRGAKAHIITDLNQPWGESPTCTSCGKCVKACPTGALFQQGSTVAEMTRDREQAGLLEGSAGEEAMDHVES